MALQTTYTSRIAAGTPGMIATERQRDISSLIVENSNGIPFGRACQQGTADNGVALGAASVAVFAGISVRDVTLVNASSLDADYVDIYVTGATAGIMTMGDVWVETGGAVSRANGVYCNATTGVLDDSGGTGPFPGLRWETSTSEAGLAIVHLSGIHRA